MTALAEHTSAAVDASELRLTMREHRDTDLPFVLSSWAASWRLSQSAKRWRGAAYRGFFDDVITGGLFRLPETRIVVACLEDDPDAIIGWLCYTPGRLPVLHYGYVRRDIPQAWGAQGGTPCRRRRVFSDLVACAQVTDALVYTFRPCERRHRNDNRIMGVERGLLDAADRRGIVARHRPIEEFLGRTRSR